MIVPDIIRRMTSPGIDEATLLDGSVSSHPDVLIQELPDSESVLFDSRTESFFGLDAVGTRTYRALVETRSVRAAFDRLSTEYNVEPPRLRRDLHTFFNRLHERGLLTFHPVSERVGPAGH